MRAVIPAFECELEEITHSRLICIFSKPHIATTRSFISDNEFLTFMSLLHFPIYILLH